MPKHTEAYWSRAVSVGAGLNSALIMNTIDRSSIFGTLTVAARLGPGLNVELVLATLTLTSTNTGRTPKSIYNEY